VRVTTNLGEFVMELDHERAPYSVQNFLQYVREGHYTNTLFHRVVAGFVIQGGGFDKDYKVKSATRKVYNESGNGLTNIRGSVAMARPAGAPHNGDCQFFINLGDNDELNPRSDRWGYAVFGKVVSGMDVVDRIGKAATGSRSPFKEDTPLDAIVIERVEPISGGT
jgi:cyclophilin family peptidyl-prolyl cis-trans isomerase